MAAPVLQSPIAPDTSNDYLRTPDGHLDLVGFNAGDVILDKPACSGAINVGGRAPARLAAEIKIGAEYDQHRLNAARIKLSCGAVPARRLRRPSLPQLPVRSSPSASDCSAPAE